MARKTMDCDRLAIRGDEKRGTSSRKSKTFERVRSRSRKNPSQKVQSWQSSQRNLSEALQINETVGRVMASLAKGAGVL